MGCGRRLTKRGPTAPGTGLKAALLPWKRRLAHPASRACPCGFAARGPVPRLAARLEIRAEEEATLIVVSADGAGAATVWIRGFLGIAGVARARPFLAPVVHAVSRVCVDLAEAATGTAGVALLVVCRRCLAHRGGQLVLRHPSAQVRRLLDLTGTRSLLLAPDRDSPDA